MGILVGTKCTPLVGDLFLFCYEGDAMKEISWCLEAEIIEAFSATSRYLDDILNINNTYCDGMVDQIYPSELHLHKDNSSDTDLPCLDLHLTISYGFV